MARKRSALRNWSEYLALRGISTLQHSFSVSENLRTAAAIGTAFYKLGPKRAARAERNIALSFPEWDEARVKEVAEASMQHMFQLFMVDSLVTPRLVGRDSWSNHVELGNIGPTLERLIRGEPIIFVTGHCGNWELLGYVLATLGYPMTALARPLDNPLINDWLLGIRQASGLQVITKWGAMQQLPKILARNGQVGFIADQNAGDQGLFVPVFGRLASSYKSVGLMAMRYHVPVIVGQAARIENDLKYRILVSDIIPPEDWADEPDPLFYITARYNRAIETLIRAAPEQYLWVHRRWKSRPRHEREGRPFPNRLPRKLEALPWMTEEEMKRIIDLSERASHQETR